MAEKPSADIGVEVVRTDQESWKPGGRKIDVVMKPKEGEEPYVPSSVPAVEPVEKTTIPQNAVVIDIETTGAMPWNSRIICISVVSLSAPEKIRTFFDKNEKKMLKEFIDWFERLGFNRIIGYNVAFDYRFIFTKAMKYRLQLPKFWKAEIYDLMNVMKQVKREYVFNFNKPGPLGKWAKVLLGRTKKMTYEQILSAWKGEEYKKIIESCENDVDITLLLYTLIQYTEGEISA